MAEREERRVQSKLSNRSDETGAGHLESRQWEETAESLPVREERRERRLEVQDSDHVIHHVITSRAHARDR